jgi:hypothetical protein
MLPQTVPLGHTLASPAHGIEHEQYLGPEDPAMP